MSLGTRLGASRWRRLGVAALVWSAALGAVTAPLYLLRPRLDKAHVALAYVLLVLAGSARGGRPVGLALAAGAFVAFDLFFLPPYNTLAVRDPLDWLALVAFLATSVVATQLLARARAEAAAARRRAEEVEGFAALGAESLGAGRAADALAAVVGVIQRTLRVERCELWLVPDGPGGGPPRLAATTATSPEVPGPDAVRVMGPFPLVEWVAAHGAAAAERSEGTARVTRPGDDEAVPSALLPPLLPDPVALVLPLRVRERTVGVLRVADGAPLAFDEAARRFLAAMSYYAALAAERVRLAAGADRAEALLEADRMKDSLLASVSHDLRTPLTTIKALAHDLGNDAGPDGGGRGGDPRARVIEAEADRLNRLVADLLDLSQLNAGALRLELEVNAADDVVVVALERVSGALAGREVRAVVPNDGPLLLGRFDLPSAVRAVVNLLDNAHKYSPPAAPVELTARRSGGLLLFEVSDRGPGVVPSERERIFDPFYRPPGTRPDTVGAGLGLTIARRLAEAQGGSLAYLPRDGGGSTFRLAFPAADEPDVFVGS